MARFFGTIGYGEAVEKVPGIWEDVITERKVYGDVLRNTYRSEESENVNNDLSISNSISIVADAKLRSHMRAIKYISFMGENWTVSSVEIALPRLILQLGEVYNGPEAPTPNAA